MDKDDVIGIFFTYDSALVYLEVRTGDFVLIKTSLNSKIWLQSGYLYNIVVCRLKQEFSQRSSISSRFKMLSDGNNNFSSRCRSTLSNF